MHIGLLQYDTIWLQPSKNLFKIRGLLESKENLPEWVFLPEMFATGYVLATNQLSLEWQHYTIETLQSYCLHFNIKCMGSIPYFEDGHWYNRMISIDGTGLFHHYDKIHLFSCAGEQKNYTSGKQTSCIQEKGWSIQPLICYDLRFPYVSHIVDQPFIIVYSANWPKARIQHWEILLRARAVENQCYVIGINRTGKDNNGYEYPGHSMCLDFNGDIILDCGSQEVFKTCIPDFDSLKSYREKWPFLNDRI